MRRSILVLVAAVAACHLASCHRADESSGEQSAARRPRIVVPLVIFEPAGKKRAVVSVEVVKTPEDIQRGLMHRRRLGADDGMLFLMGEERVHSFWMRNTFIPLDMIFIGKGMRVAGVVANATPLTDDSRRVDKPSLYVLEVNAGWAAAHGVGAGTKVRFKDVK